MGVGKRFWKIITKKGSMTKTSFFIQIFSWKPKRAMARRRLLLSL